MAAPFLLVEPLVPPAANAVINLTELSGGLSHINGYNGGDWRYYTEPTPSNVRSLCKRQGREQIYPTPFNNSAGAMPSTAYNNTYRVFALDERDILGFGGSDALPIPLTRNQGLCFTWGGSEINKGIDFTFVADQNLKRFIYMGAVSCGDYSVTATFADASMPSSSITIAGLETYSSTERWLSVKFRSVNPTTVRIRFERLTQLNGQGGSIELNATVLEKNTPAVKPKGHKRILLASKYFGGFA